jgi:ElaB/YqjD/DUF883 family membrane-anchored ribosome-binding protein
MDEQRVEGIVSEAAAKAGDAVSDLVTQTRTSVQGKLNQGKAILHEVKAGTGDAVEKATALAREASSAAGQAVAQAGEVVQGVAREVGTQAGHAATTIYQQGARAGGSLTRYAAEQPLTALLIAGALGYGLAYLIHRQ